MHVNNLNLNVKIMKKKRRIAEFERVDKETTRQQAEIERVSAEEQRKIDHVNRSAELASKADKKQEDWIKPTLLYGWTEVNSSTTPVRFMKDELGFVHLKGQLQNGSGYLFQLPEGYRSVNLLLFLVYNANRLEIDTSGRITVIGASGKISLDGINFRADK